MADPTKKKDGTPRKKRSGNPHGLPPAIVGPAPMSPFDYEFCDAYVRLVRKGGATAAFRELRPDVKDPGRLGFNMMQRPEIKEHIKAIFRLIDQERSRAAQASARAQLLTLEVADDRLLEIMQTRRRTRGEMLSRDVKELLVLGAERTYDEDGKPDGYQLSEELKTSLVEEGAPVEDADLLKAIKLTYDRRQGIVKPEKKPDVTFVGTMLYKPAWYGQPRDPKVIEGEVA